MRSTRARPGSSWRRTSAARSCGLRSRPRRSWPARPTEPFVGHTTEEQSIALEEVLVLEMLELLVEIGPAPGRFLHDSVQGDVLHCDNLSHDVRPFLSRTAL